MNNQYSPATFKAIYRFLETCGAPYVIVGGVASSIIGEPRLTVDLDVLIYVKQDNLEKLLQKAKVGGFDFDEQQAKDTAKSRLCFQMRYKSLRLDCLIAVTAFEVEMLNRSILAPLEEGSLRVPSPEDLILMKLIANRDKDWVDIKSIALRHRKKLDVVYMQQWANAWHSKDPQNSVGSRLEKLLADLKQIP